MRIKFNPPSIIEGVKKTLRKNTMKSSKFYFCDNCKKEIYDPKNGFIVEGNIYTANANQLEGLIGEAFPDTSFKKEDVLRKVFCLECFSEALQLNRNQRKQKNWLYNE